MAGRSTVTSSKLVCDHAKLAESKRKKAVLKQRELLIQKKNIIKQALSSMDQKHKVNKKVIFSDAEDSEVSHKKLKHGLKLDGNKTEGRQKLFEDDDDDSDLETNLKLNHQFEGRKGQKLLELQSRFASDPRFTLDKRFYESGSEESENEMTEALDHSEEKKKQLAILESVVNQQIKPLSEINKSRKNAEGTFMIRYDPTRKDHDKYIVKPKEQNLNEEILKKIKKKKDDKQEVLKNVQNNSKVSNKKFFAVKENLKEMLQNKSGASFSLLKLFDSKKEESHESDFNPEENLNLKKLKHKAKNPFNYDSSESEPEQEEPQRKEDEEGSDKTFFFTKNDPRFQEAFKFLKISEEEKRKTDDYAEKRKMLKKIIKQRIKNNNRKKIHFKKKLGGLKKTLKNKERKTKLK